ncbi:MAG: hypothetical protein JNJ65_08755 [Cyclobacteriaceae bacterium]|jgi:uncharacterized damage-inducible protein DinB|nr:hypothetical protein [Cyclobacteriaceae bacterium]
MTQLFTAGKTILAQLSDVVSQISEEDFRKPSAALSQSTVGQHLRHTLEFFICLEQGYELGVVNYDKRIHNKAMENDKHIALHTIRQIQEFVGMNQADKSLKLDVGYQPDSEECVSIDTNYLRELTYNIEHAVHHMAIMKIGIREVASYVKLSPDFGIAVSTLRYKESAVAAR